jgi:two-component system OmpR family response regulator
MGEGRRRLLVIEDDPETAEQLVDFLSTSGYQVDLAADGNEGLRRGRSVDYAVMTIDRMLPDIDGLDVIRRFREDGIVTPALIISALGEIDDRVRGLRAGGDDYLVKPFAFAELLARVEALARRSATVVKETVLRVGDLELDLVARTAPAGAGKSSCCRANFKFSSTSFAMTAALFRARCCCNTYGICTSTLDVYVGRVRRKVDSQQAYPLIHTIRGIGFCVRAPS